MSFWTDTKAIFAFGFTTGITVAAATQLLLALSAEGKPKLLANGSASSSNSSSSSATAKALDALERQLTITSDKLHRIARQMVSEMRRGLAADGQTLKMIPSYVSKLPDGSETGTFLALDLGGTNFRVCEVTLLGGSGRVSDGVRQLVRVRQKKFTVGDDLKAADGVKLFDFFADCVKAFLVECQSEDAKVGGQQPDRNNEKLGFTFSFPVRQVAINKGFLMTWTKGFTNRGVEDEDVVKLLQEAFLRKDLNIQVTALVNDTVGTLVAHAYADPQTKVGVILGTGTNAAYVENIEHISKWQGGPVPSGQMIINMEWGAFDEEHAVLPITTYDLQLDRDSPNAGHQTFEKMISGMYLGEIVRLILLDLTVTGILFGGKYPPSPELAKPYNFETAYMSRIERDHSHELSDTKSVLEDLLRIPSTTLSDRRAVKRVCELVGTRAARLSAAGVAAVVSKMNKLDGCTVAIDGSLFEHYPHFGNRMRDALFELLGINGENIKLAQARDGSGQGAALIAALAN
ncbi:hexokinase A [Quaeritorhiza haematococci]|nr:hexokinase A [Quaeritorhiza haematococci]